MPMMKALAPTGMGTCPCHPTTLAAMAESIAIHHADWLDLPSLIEPASVDLVYIDPPFGTGATQRTPPGAAKAGRAVSAAYEDDLRDVGAWLKWIEPRLRATV